METSAVLLRAFAVLEREMKDGTPLMELRSTGSVTKDLFEVEKDLREALAQKIKEFAGLDESKNVPWLSTMDTKTELQFTQSPAAEVTKGCVIAPSGTGLVDSEFPRAQSSARR